MSERGVYDNGGSADEGRRKKKNLRACVPQVKNRGNTESNLSQHPEIVPVDKLISLNINAERITP